MITRNQQRGIEAENLLIDENKFFPFLSPN